MRILGFTSGTRKGGQEGAQDKTTHQLNSWTVRGSDLCFSPLVDETRALLNDEKKSLRGGRWQGFQIERCLGQEQGLK